jgi:hypothetical protein
VLIPRQDRAAKRGESKKNQQIVPGRGHNASMTQLRGKSNK